MADFSQDKKYNKIWRNSTFQEVVFSGGNISQFVNDVGYTTSTSSIDADSFLSTSSFNRYTGSSDSQFAGTASLALTASYFSGSISSAISSSYAETASYVNPLVQDVTITGNSIFQGDFTSKDITGTPRINNRELIDSSSTSSLNWDVRQFIDSNGAASLDYDQRLLYDTNGSTVVLDWGNGQFTGTSSYAISADTASFLLGSIESASFATTASFAQTASFLLGSIESASYATTSSFAQTASYYKETEPIFSAVSGTYVITSSFNNFTSSFNTGSFTGSFIGNLTGTSSFSNVAFDVLNKATYTVGLLSGSGTWGQSFNGTITLPSADILLYDNPTFSGSAQIYSINGGTSGTGGIPALTDNETNYVLVDYNVGNPRWNITTSDISNDSNIALVYIVYRLGNFIHVLDFGDQGAGLSNKINRRLEKTERFARESGLQLGLSGSTGVVTIESGVAWNGSNRQELSAVNSQDDVFFKNYLESGSWVVSTDPGVDVFNNRYYNSGSELFEVETGKYLVNYYYRGQEINDHIYEVYSQAQYNSVAEAQLATNPLLPELVSSHTFLTGRIIIQSGSLTGLVESAYATVFQATNVTAHNDLTGLQGGSGNEFYHISANEAANLALVNTDNQFQTSQTISGTLITTNGAIITGSFNITGSTTLNGGVNVDNKFVFVNNKFDLPLAVGGVITLEDNVSYFFTTTVDLLGDRLLCGENTTLLGGSSENSRIKSTGLTSGSGALIESQWSIPIKNLTIEAELALNLNGTGSATTAIDWFGVNFTDCPNVGLIANYTNFIMQDSSLLNSANMVFDGTIATVASLQSLFSGRAGETTVRFADTANITRRARFAYSAFVAFGGATAIDFSSLATTPPEGFILDTVNFSGGATYLGGLDHTSLKSLFTNCVGITNTTNAAHYYMVNNTTDTTIGVANVNVWVKANGTTTEGSGNSPKWIHTDNRATYTGSLSVPFHVILNATVRSGTTNQVISIGIAKNGTIIDDSETTIRTATANQEYPGTTQTIVLMATGDYIELYVRNAASPNIRVADLQFVANKINA